MSDLTDHIHLLFQNKEYQQIIDTVEALPENQWTSELIFMLARTYNACNYSAVPSIDSAVAGSQDFLGRYRVITQIQAAADRTMAERALNLLLSLEETLAGDHEWNLEVGISFFYLGRDGEALPYFEQALADCPGDKSIEEYIDICRSHIACPRHLKPFRVRTMEGWQAFADREAHLRSLMDSSKTENVNEELVARCYEILNLAFDSPAFELGFNGKKYDLILSPEGDRVRLFQLAYFAKCAPESIRKHWNIIVGRPAFAKYVMRMHGLEVEAKDFQSWIDIQGEKKFELSLHCEKLLPMLRENESNAYSLAYILVDQVLGELASMRYVTNMKLLTAPNTGEYLPLSDVPDFIKNKIDPEGWAKSADPETACESWAGYRGNPSREESCPLRADVIAGMTCCLPLINAYFGNDNYYMDLLHRDGAVPGFFFWSLDGFGKDDILPFRDQIEAAVLQKAGAAAVTFTGGATGEVYGYLDFIAWDLPAVINAAREVMSAAPVKEAGFHTFRMDIYGVGLLRVSEAEG